MDANSRWCDAENRWWVTELLAANCEKAWIHPGEKIPCRSGMRRKNEGETNDQECGGMCWSLAQNHETHSLERTYTDFGKEEEEDARLMDLCEAKSKEWAKH